MPHNAAYDQCLHYLPLMSSNILDTTTGSRMANFKILDKYGKYYNNPKYWDT